MTFDNGPVKICNVTNAAQNGEEPKKQLETAATYMYENLTVGVTRYYEAIKADQLIERMIAIYDLREGINTNQIAVTEDGAQFLIRQIQNAENENGIKILKLALERNGEEYEITG